MLKKIRDVWRGLAWPKHEKFARRKSIRFSKRSKFRVHRVGSRKSSPRSSHIINARSTTAASCTASTGITRRMDPYDRMTVNVNESTSDRSAKGCDSKNPVSSTARRSLSGHCSTSTTNFNQRCDRETPPPTTTEKPGPDEREIDVTDRSGSAKKVEDIVAECQSASVGSPSFRSDALLHPMPVTLPKNRPKHLHVPVVKKSCQLKAQNLRYGQIRRTIKWLQWENKMPALERSTNDALALHYAAARGCMDCVRVLAQSPLQHSANMQMENDVTPVYLAAQEGHIDVLKFLVLEAGGSLYVRAKDGMAPVHAAAQMGCLSCVKWMIKDQGVDPNLRDGDGATPLHFAASRGHVDTVRWLLRHGAKLLLDKYDKSPINDAAENQQIECLNVLVQHGTAPDYYDERKEANGKLYGCTCPKGDPTTRCSYADCVNYSPNQEPFYLHHPTLPTNSTKNKTLPHKTHIGNNKNVICNSSHIKITNGKVVNGSGGDGGGSGSSAAAPPDKPTDCHNKCNGFYINPANSVLSSAGENHRNSNDPFYLHNPREVIYTRVQDVFHLNEDRGRRISNDSSISSGSSTIAAKSNSSINGLTVKVEVHSSSSGAGSDTNLSSPEISDAGKTTENEYEDIYVIKEDTIGDLKTNGTIRRDSRDSGSHSRSESISSTNSNIIRVVSVLEEKLVDNQDDFESGVSSASPSDLGHSEEEQEILKITRNHHTLPHQHPNGRLLKRVVSEPGAIYCPPPPPPLPNSNVLNATPQPPSSEPKSTRQIEPSSIYSGNVTVENVSSNRNSSTVLLNTTNDETNSFELSKSDTYSSSPSSERSTTVVVTTGSVESVSPSSDSSSANAAATTAGPHLVNKQLVLPFIPPKFSNTDNDSNSLIKPSEYLRSIAATKSTTTTTNGVKLVKTKSELNITTLEAAEKPHVTVTVKESAAAAAAAAATATTAAAAPSTTSTSIVIAKPQEAGPPPPPLPEADKQTTSTTTAPKVQPLSFISTNDLTSVQLRRTEKTVASKTMSAPYGTSTLITPSQPFQSQKQDLIAELKMSKDILGIKKMKVERVKMEEKQEKELATEIFKQFSVENFVGQVPDTDSTGNPIPPWKRQMMAKKLAEKAKKEHEEQFLREAENRRLQAIPAWKRQLLQAKKTDDKCYTNHPREAVANSTEMTVNLSVATKPNSANTEEDNNKENSIPESKQQNSETEAKENNNNKDAVDEQAHIIPWRAQLRKTNSKLNLLE